MDRDEMRGRTKLVIGNLTQSRVLSGYAGDGWTFLSLETLLADLQRRDSAPHVAVKVTAASPGEPTHSEPAHRIQPARPSTPSADCGEVCRKSDGSQG